ncbi:hypothetical protein FA13DRAFT_1418224 [Coprinellus micaceus]|uniref:Uncharacterized protein n=1 Tax=Coprinellus micaceus TaxID=71717 RepID=A0A4Y7SN79_COPMI|nr:hypothetical protein FA13DRAFT_1418224 [Coprinellus micaceus]
MNPTWPPSRMQMDGPCLDYSAPRSGFIARRSSRMESSALTCLLSSVFFQACSIQDLGRFIRVSWFPACPQVLPILPRWYFRLISLMHICPRVSMEAPTVICELQYGSLANKSFVLKAHRVHRSILHRGRDRLLFDLLKGESTNAAAELWVCNQYCTSSYLGAVVARQNRREWVPRL